MGELYLANCRSNIEDLRNRLRLNRTVVAGSLLNASDYRYFDGLCKPIDDEFYLLLSDPAFMRTVEDYIQKVGAPAYIAEESAFVRRKEDEYQTDDLIRRHELTGLELEALGQVATLKAGVQAITSILSERVE